MSKRRTWFEFLLIGFVVVLVIAVVGYMAISTKWNGEMQDEYARIKAKGEPLTCADLAPDPIPDQINGALVYQRAMALVPSGSVTGSDAEIINNLLSKEERAKDPSLWDKSQEALARSKPMLDLVAEAAKYKQCRYPVKWEDGAAAMFPHYAKLRDLARWQAADALVKAKNGDMAGSVQANIIGLSVGESIRDEPILISELVRIAMLRVTLKSLYDSVEFGEMSELEARRLDSALAKIRIDEGYVNAMIGERAFGMWAFDEVAKKGSQAWGEFSDSGLQAGFSNLPMFLSTHKIGRPILNADRTYYLRFMTEQIELAKKPYYKVASKPAKVDLINEAPSYAPITKILCPVFSRARLSSDRAMAEIAVTRAGLGVFAYKDKYGAYPKTLGDIKSKLNWIVPEDPFNGKELVYKKTSNGFVVYSIGLNLKDEGGKMPDPRKNDPNEGDVVWNVAE